MTIFSRVKPLISQPLFSSTKRCSHHRILAIEPSRWQWRKFKDYMLLYIFLGLIPVTTIIFYADVMIGPATLTEIPEDYVPKHWEYYRHPITRWLAENILPSPQQQYEKYLHFLFQEAEKQSLVGLEAKMKDLIAERSDYKAYFYRPITAKYHRGIKYDANITAARQGD